MKLLALPIPLVLGAHSMQAPERLPLRVLYAGNAGTEYTKAAMGFLSEHAAKVTFVESRKLTTRDFKDIDVLIVDGEVETHDAQGQLQLKSEKINLTLSELQGMPTLLMGGQGGFLADDLKLKLSWRHG